MDKFIVIDGNSLINRAYYGLPPLKSLSGKPCGATFGFLNMLLNLISTENPKYLACVFDAGKHTFRHDIYAEYKGTREHMPEDLHAQLLDLKELLNAMGIKTIEIPEIEADDIIGSVSRKYDADFILVSGDKDLFQLVKENVTVYHTRRGTSDVVKITPEELQKSYSITPEQVIELKAIMGDKSDNIPGVTGIGEIGANKLISEYGSLDNVYNNLEKISGNVKTKLEMWKEQAYMSKELATIKLDVDLPFELQDCEYKLPFNEDARIICEELGFKALLKRKEFFEIMAESKPEVKFDSVPIIELDSDEKLKKFFVESTNRCAVTIDKMYYGFCFGENEYCINKYSELFNKNIDGFKNFFASKEEKVCFDSKQLMHELEVYGIVLNNYYDVSLSIYVANEMDAEITLEEALKLNGINTNNKTLALLKLKEIYVEKLISNLQMKLFLDIELPLVEVLFNMEVDGITIDVEQIKILSRAYHQELDDITKQIYISAGEEFNINSPKQLQNILFDKLKIPYKGKLGTSIEILNAIEDRHEIVPLIIRYRKISKLISTYLDGLMQTIKEDGKIHTTYMQRTTSTGRLSSREPNLQNLPIRDDEGKQLRKMFTSSFNGGSIISADYNQIELRLIANFSKDENMISDYLSGKDIHSATASKIFNVPIENVTANQRRMAKSVNFGIIYGISAFGLAQNIGSTTKDASEFIHKYMTVYPKVKDYGEECIFKAKKLGYASTFMGRIRHLPDIYSSNHVVRSFAERVAKNMPLQGSASDIIKMAMIKVFNRFKNENMKSKMILQIHDELVVDCYPGESNKVKKILKEEMESVINLTVPLTVEVSEGKTLFEAK